MSVPAPYSALFSPSDGSFSASRTTAAIDLGSGAGRALLVLAMGDGGTPAGYSFTGATAGGVALTAGTEKTTTGNVRRAFWATDADGLPTGSQTITVSTNGTRNMFIMCVVYKDGASSGASIAVTPTAFASTAVSGGANSYTVGTTTTAGLAVAIACIGGALASDASSTNASTYNRYNGGQSFETFSKAGSAGSTAITWQTAGGSSIIYDTFGFALLGSSASSGPTLTAATGTVASSTSASIGVTTDTASGTLYRYVSTNSTETAATIKASGTSSTVTATGAQGPFTATGLTAGLTYYAHFVHTASAVDSAVVSAGPIYPGTWRPATDVSVSGWAATGAASNALALDEDTAGDSDYITSPTLSGSASTAILALDEALPAGTYTLKVRARTTSGTGTLTVTAVNDAGTSQGAAPPQAIDSTWTTYTLSITTTGSATRVKLDVTT